MLSGASDAPYSAGYRKIDIADDVSGHTFPAAVFYPTEQPSELVRFGPFEMDIAPGSQVATGHFPIVIISHGSGGSHLGHRDTALFLAQRGYSVAAPLHPFNNYQDNRAEGTVETWAARPKHVSATLDFVLNDPKLEHSVDTDRVAVIGHSAGGYTALALAGGIPDTSHIIELCEAPRKENQKFCSLGASVRLEAKTLSALADDRFKAAVLMAPVGVLFKTADSLRDVEAAILQLHAQNDELLTVTDHAEVIAENLPDKDRLTYRVVEGAGHYSFITPFPQSIKSEVGEATEDPGGFDRTAFHEKLNPQILEFLNASLNYQAVGK